MENISPLKAIREKCLDCSCGSRKEVELCPISKCALFPFRFGKNPFRKRSYSEDQLEALRERAKKNLHGIDEEAGM